jgi:glycosyltransferase involved in cell wall biosynthesis
LARILFYTPFNQRSRDVETLMLAFRDQGHHVVSLTQLRGDQINQFLISRGIDAHSHLVAGRPGSLWYYLKHLLYFVRFCRHHNIQVVYSHLEPANFVAVIGQYFINARTFICRHHIDEAQLYRFDKHFSYRLTYRLAKKIIVVSDQARQYMINHEKISAERIVHINLAYDFSAFPQADKTRSAEIRNEYGANILLLTACRLTEFKRPELSLKVVRRLRDDGLDAKLILLGRGEMETELRALINQLNLGDSVFMPGHVGNVMDYMAAADFLLHPSVLESSCVAVKEAGLAELPVIACSGVGDFDDYLVHNTNAFVVTRDRFVADAAAMIASNHDNAQHLKNVTANLKREILRLFDIRNIAQQYEELNNVKAETRST